MSVNAPWNVTRTRNANRRSRRISPVTAWSTTNTYPSQFKGAKYRFPSTPSPGSPPGRGQPWVPPKPYRMYSVEVTSGGYHYRWRNSLNRPYEEIADSGVISLQVGPGDSFLWLGSTTVDRLPDVPLWVEGSAINSAKSDLLNSDFNTLVTLVELLKTWELLNESLAKLIRFALRTRDAVKRVRVANNRAKRSAAQRDSDIPYEAYRYWQRQAARDYAYARKVSSEVKRRYGASFAPDGSTILSVRYGWLPLIADVQGLAKLLAETVRPSGSDVTGKGRSSDTTRYFLVAPSIKDVWDLNSRGERSAFCRLDYRVSDAYLHFLSRAGLVSPWLPAWERVPFSFVVDWLIPIGSALEAMSADIGLDYLGGSVSLRSKVQTTLKQANNVPSDGTEAPTLSVESTFLRRKTFSSPPVARLFVRNPFSSPLAIANLATLILLRKGLGNPGRST